MEEILKGIDYIGYYDDVGNHVIEICQEEMVELVKRVTKADIVEVIKIYNK